MMASRGGSYQLATVTRAPGRPRLQPDGHVGRAVTVDAGIRVMIRFSEPWPAVAATDRLDRTRSKAGPSARRLARAMPAQACQ